MSICRALHSKSANERIFKTLEQSTITSPEEGKAGVEQWLIRGGVGGGNPPLSTNEGVAGSTGGIMKIQAREDKNSSMHPVACPQNVSGLTYAREQAAIREQSQNRKSAALLPPPPQKNLFLPQNIPAPSKIRAKTG